ncbi:MAG: DHH family phosphoesterase [Candidatus Thorarchaeota archaeon]
MNIRPLIANAQKVLILGHHNADPDAVCSMIAFRNLLVDINPEAICTLACDDVSRLSKQILHIFAPDIEILEHVEGEYDLVVVLDTNSRLQLGPQFGQYLDNPSQVIVIDHHAENPDVGEIASHALVDSATSSTCEMLTQLFEELDVKIKEITANLLLCGILFDTRRFFYAKKSTLSAAIRLIENGADYQSCINSLIIRPDRSERIARLKAAGRLVVHTIDKWVIVTAKIGAFEASSCRGLVDLGADVAIVGGKPSADVVRISSRSTKEFYESTGVRLGADVMSLLGDIIGGTGGGHPNAAGANGRKNRKEALLKSVELIRTAIMSQKKEETKKSN